MTDGKQDIIAKPGERSKYDDGNFKDKEVIKFIQDAKVTRRMQERYWSQIFEDSEEEDSEPDEEEEKPGRERRSNAFDGEGNKQTENDEREEEEGFDDDGPEDNDMDSSEEEDYRTVDPRKERDEL